MCLIYRNFEIHITACFWHLAISSCHITTCLLRFALQNCYFAPCFWHIAISSCHSTTCFWRSALQNWHFTTWCWPITISRCHITTCFFIDLLFRIVILWYVLDISQFRVGILRRVVWRFPVTASDLARGYRGYPTPTCSRFHNFRTPWFKLS